MTPGDLVTGKELGNLREMGDRTVALVALVRDAFRDLTTAPLGDAERLRHELREQEKAVTEALARREAALLFVPLHLERIAGHADSLGQAVRTMVGDGVPFTERAMREVTGLFERALELVECARDAVLTGNRVLLRHLVTHGMQYSQLADDYALAHQQRLAEGLCVAQASSIYLAMVDYLKGVEAHTRQIGQQLTAIRGA